MIENFFIFFLKLKLSKKTMEEKKFNFVYITTNLINGMQYVGEHSTDDMNCPRTKRYLGGGRYLARAIKKEGRKNFIRQDLEFFPTKKEAFCAQAKYIKHFKTFILYGGYNLDETGGVASGTKVSEETKKKTSNTLKGHHRSEESKKKQGDSLRGKKHSKEHVENFIKSRKGLKYKKKDPNLPKREFSKEHKKHIGESKTGEKSPMFGTNFYNIWVEKEGKEIANQKYLNFKEKCKIVSTGRILSKESKKKMSETLKKRKKIHCDYCNRDFFTWVFEKWHGEKCKHKNKI
jgi:group I intron endonuclease